MKLNTKSRYAVMAFCYMAATSRGRPVPLAEIAQHQSISVSYLEQIFAHLRRAQLVKSVRGPGGGYLPHTGLEQISIAEIVQAIDCDRAGGPGGAAASDCHTDTAGEHLTRDLWEQLGNQIHGYLAGISVADVLVGGVPGAVGLARGDSVVAAGDDD